jgi:hypothetical protein
MITGIERRVSLARISVRTSKPSHSSSGAACGQILGINQRSIERAPEALPVPLTSLRVHHSSGGIQRKRFQASEHSRVTLSRIGNPEETGFSLIHIEWDRRPGLDDEYCRRQFP